MHREIHMHMRTLYLWSSALMFCSWEGSYLFKSSSTTVRAAWLIGSCGRETFRILLGDFWGRRSYTMGLFGMIFFCLCLLLGCWTKNELSRLMHWEALLRCANFRQNLMMFKNLLIRTLSIYLCAVRFIERGFLACLFTSVHVRLFHCSVLFCSS